MDDLKCKYLLDEFLTFYDKSSFENTDNERKYELWRKHYNFPFDPPGYKQNQLAKEMLDYAWEKYSLIYDKIKYFEMTEQQIQEKMSLLKYQLDWRDPLSLTTIFFVGSFESDPFIKMEEETYTLCFPIEIAWNELRLNQELARVVHCCKSNLPPSHTRTLGQLVFQEGISLHAAQQLADYEQKQGPVQYFENESCTREPNRIMINILTHLKRTDYEALYSFTKGTGASGFEKEAVYTGWNLIGYLLNNGETLDGLAGVPAGEVDSLVEETVYSLLNHAYLTQPQE